MHYNISQPVDTVFNAIEDLVELAEHANSLMSAQQMIDLAYVIFAKQPILQHNLRLWNRRPLAERTWDNMLEHFRDAQADLSSLPTAGDICHLQPAHQANAFEPMTELVAQHLLDAMTPLADSPAAPPELGSSLQRPESDLQTREAAMMLTQTQDLVTLMCSTSQTSTPQHNSRQSTTGGSSGRQSDRGRSRGRGASTCSSNTRLCCWSHGACAHTGIDCNTPSTGHQTSATFDNMLEGSTTGCYWICTA